MAESTDVLRIANAVLARLCGTFAPDADRAVQIQKRPQAEGLSRNYAARSIPMPGRRRLHLRGGDGMLAVATESRQSDFAVELL